MKPEIIIGSVLVALLAMAMSAFPATYQQKVAWDAGVTNCDGVAVTASPATYRIFVRASGFGSTNWPPAAWVGTATTGTVTLTLGGVVYDICLDAYDTAQAALFSNTPPEWCGVTPTNGQTMFRTPQKRPRNDTMRIP